MSALNASSLTGIQKTAVLCLALSPEESAELMEDLRPEELEAVTRAIVSLGSVDESVVRDVFEEYRTGARDAAPVVAGGVDVARQLLASVGDAKKADALVTRIQDEIAGESFSFLKELEPNTVARLLGDEHPQTAAVVLSVLEPTEVSRIVPALPEESRVDLLYRMAGLRAVTPESLTLVGDELKRKAQQWSGSKPAASGDPARVARVMNSLPGDLDDTLLAALGQRDEVLAARIKALMFVFEDLLCIDKKGIQRILREIDSADLALALKGASDELKSHITENMSSRAAQAMREEMELMGPVRVKDVEVAQGNILDVVRQLEESEEVVIARGGTDDDFVS